MRCVETESLTSVTHLATIPVGIGGLSEVQGSNIVYWGNESGEIGYLDTGKLTRRDYSGLVINHVVWNSIPL